MKKTKQYSWWRLDRLLVQLFARLLLMLWMRLTWHSRANRALRFRTKFELSRQREISRQRRAEALHRHPQKEGDDMPRINQNKMAIEVTKREGGKVPVNIAQVKEVQKHVLDVLAEQSDKDVLALLNRRRKK